MTVLRNKIAISACKRTPFGGFLSSFKAKTAMQLASVVLKEISYKKQIDAVYMGQVLSASCGQNPARQAATLGEIPFDVPAVTVNKVCGSGLFAIITACNDILLNDAKCIIAGGMESLSNVPFSSNNIRFGVKMGHFQFNDLLLKDGLEDAYNYKLMGVIADETASKFKITRDEQEEYVDLSLKRYKSHDFKDEIIQTFDVISDEAPLKVNPDKFKNLKPSFAKAEGSKGTITAATSSSLADGAAALLLEGENNDAIAYICGHKTYSCHPNDFAEAPVHAIRGLCEELNWDLNSVDLFEINEAFAAVPLIAIKELNLDINKVNKRGGACIVGHPLGATGARIVGSLAYQLKPGQKGIAVACIGGGEAIAIALSKEA